MATKQREPHLPQHQHQHPTVAAIEAVQRLHELETAHEAVLAAGRALNRVIPDTFHDSPLTLAWDANLDAARELGELVKKARAHVRRMARQAAAAGEDLGEGQG